MSDAHTPGGWPDAARPGVPLEPERDGWHWVAFPSRDPAVPLKWDAQQGAWLDPDDSIVTMGPGWVGPQANYLGPCLTPAEDAARVAAARREGVEAAAHEIDCGCDIRDAVLARLEVHGHDRASYLCRHGDLCCALQAAEIRALLEDGR